MNCNRVNPFLLPKHEFFKILEATKKRSSQLPSIENVSAEQTDFWERTELGGRMLLKQKSIRKTLRDI